MSHVVRKWAFGHMQTAKLLARLRGCAGSPEALLFALCPKAHFLTARLRLSRSIALEVLSMSTACKSKQQSFWRDCANVQARLKICCLHMSEGPFSHGEVHDL